jgi:CoA:oxalate CoA-transferase
MSHARPLVGLTVLDFTRVFSGPYATLLLSDLGANVIKVEHPSGGDDSRTFGPFVAGTSGYFEALNRGKRSIAMNYKQPDGQALLRELASHADVLIENFRPGQMARFGLDYARLSAISPKLIYVSLSGFGHTGPDSARGCYDVVAQAESGLMSATGLPELPIKTGPALADAITGLTAATGLLAALWGRERTGRGAHLDIAMVDSVFACLENVLAAYDVTGVVPARQSNADVSLAPFDSFQTVDGWVVIGVGTDALWQKLAGLLGENLAHDARFRTNALRLTHYDVLRPMIATWCEVQPSADVLQYLHAVGIPAGRVRGIEELACDPRLEARRMIARLALDNEVSLRVPGCPIQISDVEPLIYVRAPKLGEHTAEVLAQFTSRSAPPPMPATSLSSSA